MKVALSHAPLILICLSYLFVWLFNRLYLWLPLSFIAYLIYFYNGQLAAPILFLFWILFFATVWLERSESNLGFIPFFILMVIGYALFLQAFSPVAWDSVARSVDINHSIAVSPSILLPLNALFFLGMLTPLNHSIKGWLLALFLGALFASGLIFLMINFFASVEAKPMDLMQNINDIIFVTLPTEAFFRGFIQRELTNNIRATGSSLFAILISAMLFSSLILLKTHSQEFTLIAFLVSVILGTIYQITKRIEVPILCHIFLNLGLQKFS
jgi:uncharacterized protein